MSLQDATVNMNAGEKRTPYASAAVSTGTLTITGSPTYTLYNSAGTSVAGHIAQAVTGYDNSALATVRVWKLLDSASPALTADRYRIVFTFSATKSVDSLTETFVREVGVIVSAVP